MISNLILLPLIFVAIIAIVSKYFVKYSDLMFFMLLENYIIIVITIIVAIIIKGQSNNLSYGNMLYYFYIVHLK